MIYVVELLDEIRNRLDDTGGNLVASELPVITTTPYALWQRADVEPTLVWSNTYLCRCVNWAIREIALRTGGIADSSSQRTDITRIDIVAGQRAYILHPSILAIEDVKRASDNFQLIKTTVARLYEEQGYAWTTQTGSVEQYFEDGQQGYLTVFPTPTTSDVLLLLVKRTSTDSIGWNEDLAAEGPTYDDLLTSLLDIPDSYKDAIVVGACSQAWLKRDADANNMPLAVQAAQEFTQMVGPQVSIRQLANRKANSQITVAIGGQYNNGHYSSEGRL